MATLFFRRPRITILLLCLILVSGLSSYVLLPRMEDPLLTPRAAIINTVFPGADADRVEALVTEKIEDELREIDEIKKLTSQSKAGISTISIELRDDVYETTTIWSRIRDKLGDTVPFLPSGAMEPEFDAVDVKAYALIVALKWDQESEPNYAILRRLAENLDDELKAVSGTEEVDTFGDPQEEVLVEIELPRLAGLGLTVEDVARQIGASDAKAAAGQLRSKSDLLVEVSGELDSLDRIGQIPIRNTARGGFVLLSDIATLSRAKREPVNSLTLVEGEPAIALGVMVRPAVRVDHWARDASDALANFKNSLPKGVALETLFEQNEYVATRLTDLLKNLLFGAAAVAGVIFVMMGWRSALIVTSALPLAALMVLSGMRFLSIPIHQMSVTGLIVALGLLIDNAIVVVDEVSVKLRSGKSPLDAVGESVRHLAIPLLGSTITTALSFAPIALMPGPAGEFVGSIAVSVIMAIWSSLFLALTIVPALTAMGISVNEERRDGWWQSGLSIGALTKAYQASLRFVFRRPLIGIGLGAVLPLIGFVQFGSLPEAFFPPADRDQIQIEVEFPAQTSIGETERQVKRMRDLLLQDENVEAVTWFLGESAPPFYYNLIPKKKNTSSYAQALVTLRSIDNLSNNIRRYQEQLDRAFPEARVVALQLEQGPPFSAPIEIRLYGPDKQVLGKLGDDVRLVLSQVKDVVHTRSDLGESVPKVSFQVPEEDARLAGLNYADIAGQINASLEGAVGGSILESTEELPVRVRVASFKRADLNSIASTELMAADRSGRFAGRSLSALGSVSLVPESATITRRNGRRMNEVQAFLAAGVLPVEAQKEFTERLETHEFESPDGGKYKFELPDGYELEFGGASAERNNAIGNLMANVGVLGVLMVATLVLSFSSFRMAGIIGAIATLSGGLGVGALWLFGYPFGFMAIVGTMGLIGVAINDAIVVLAAIREDKAARTGDPDAVREVVLHASRHVVATTLTTIAGFVPLLLGGGGFWPPLAVSIAGGVSGATILALYFAPSAYIALMCRGCKDDAVPVSV